MLNALTDDLGTGHGLIFADAVFLHFNPDEMKLVLRKVFEALRLNGKLAFSLKRGNGEELTDQKLGAMRYFKYWEPDVIKAELETAGFSDIQIEIAEDYCGPQKPNWLMIIATKASR